MAQVQKPTQQVKFINGQVFICSPVTANFKGQLTESGPYKFQVKHLIRAVQIRMEHCMGQLLEAYEKEQITQVFTSEHGIEIHFACGECFHTGSYEVMERLLFKLQVNLPVEGLDIHQMYELLTCREADQLFKAWLQAGYSWDSRACLLDFLRDDIRRKEQSNG